MEKILLIVVFCLTLVGSSFAAGTASDNDQKTNYDKGASLIKKAKKLERIFRKEFDVKAVLSTEKFRQLAEVIVSIDGNIIKAEESAEDMYSAIDLVLDKIDRQAKKYREKIKERKHINANSTNEYTERVSLSEKNIVKTENYIVKPLTLEEAAMQIDTLEQDFIVFRNAETNDINVLYRKKDGNFGWIEPK